ncbi:MAG: TonB family protein [Bacteroidetes bacterium]|jgi:TonB family protein|nr:TonB family protein [Bacteroidota bacterium]
MKKAQIQSLILLLTSLLVLVGCGSSKEFNTEDGFKPEADLSSAELEQLRSQVLDSSELDVAPKVKNGMRSLFYGLQYPEEARKAGAGGRVIIDFIVDLDGNPRDLVVAKSAGYGLDEEAIRLVKSGTFIPAQKDGEAVVARQTLPILFSMP